MTINLYQEAPTRKFNFSIEEIDSNKSSLIDWYNFVRRREAELTFSLFPNIRFPLALELGAGNGVQSITIARHCDHLVCTEIDEKSHRSLGQAFLERKLPNVEYRICDAQDLSKFGDNTFNLIFSSNVLEHIPNPFACLSECRRVLKDNGIMLHTMPSRWWKIFCFSLSLGRQSVHGVSSNHLSEFYAFGHKVWIAKFQENGFRVTETVGFPFYVGHGNTFILIIKAGNLMHLPASFLYIVKKKLPRPTMFST